MAFEAIIGEVDYNERDVVSVALGVFVTPDGHDSAPVFSGRFCDKLLDPGDERPQSRGSKESRFVLSCESCFAEKGAESKTGVSHALVRRTTFIGGRQSAVHQPPQIDAYRCGRDEPKLAESRVAASYIRRSIEHASEPPIGCEALQSAGRIGDRHEMLPRGFRDRRNTIPEEPEERHRFESRTGFR